MKKVVLGIVLLSFLATGCVHRLTDFTIISSKNVDLSSMSKYKRGSARVEGEDRMWIILIIPTKFSINMKTAIDRAIESTPGCVALVDGVLSQESWYFLVGTGAFIVEGTPLIDPTLASAENFSPYNMCYLNEDGSVKENKQISKEEFEKIKSEMSTKD